MKVRIDVLDRLQEEEGFVRLTMNSGEIIYGHPLIISFDEDEDGMDTVKTIMFKPLGSEIEKFYKLEDIDHYESVDEDDIPPYE